MHRITVTVVPPASEAQLYQRAGSLAGHTLGEIARQSGLMVPDTLRRNKGWIGSLLERCLGAYSGNRAQPDFPQLGVELKTIPLTATGKPLESTFVCLASLIGNSGLCWQTSYVRLKLQRVLWIPIVGERWLPPALRRIGTPHLWSPSIQQAQQLQQDWEELMDCVVLGQVDQISAQRGEVLQLRPKAANSRALTAAIGHRGQPIMTLPLGFYLKTAFTRKLLADAAQCLLTVE